MTGKATIARASSSLESQVLTQLDQKKCDDDTSRQYMIQILQILQGRPVLSSIVAPPIDISVSTPDVATNSSTIHAPVSQVTNPTFDPSLSHSPLQSDQSTFRPMSFPVASPKDLAVQSRSVDNGNQQYQVVPLTSRRTSQSAIQIYPSTSFHSPWQYRTPVCC